MSKYTVGVDFGTLSARALVVDIENGCEKGTAVMNYPHAVMTSELPTGEKLPDGYALQHPQDYLDCISYVIPEAIRQSGVDKDDIIALGIDMTACTVLPVDKNYDPLCFKEKYVHEKHAYVKLWKHHGAQRLADIMTEKGQEYLKDYGRIASPEWLFPKVWETLRDAKELYDDTYSFIEAGEWLIQRLTGSAHKGITATTIKDMWSEKNGYPPKEFFESLDEDFKDVTDKLPEKVLHLGDVAGRIDKNGNEMTGLNIGTPVCTFMTDAHVAYASIGKIVPGTMLMIIGTSTCDIMASDVYKEIDGICGVTKDSIIDGLYGYEAGQSGVGDVFDWFVKNCVPKSYYDEAESKNTDIHALLTEKAAKLKPGQSGLISLDWFNGNRCVLVDFDLTGMVLGMTLETKPEEIYRALIEATAFGTRKIIESFEESDVPITNLVACGGISKKNRMLMQIYADVLNKDIGVVRTKQSGALGSAVYAAAASGAYKDIYEASAKMAGLEDEIYTPNTENAKIYDELYKEYIELHDYFGRGVNNVMKRLRNLKNHV